MFILCPWCNGPIGVPTAEHDDVGICMLCGKPVRYQLFPEEHFDRVNSFDEMTAEQVVAVRQMQNRLPGFRRLQQQLH